MKKLLYLFTLLAFVVSAGKPASAQEITPYSAEAGLVKIAIVSSSLPAAKVLMKGFEKDVRVFVAPDEEPMSEVFRRISDKCSKAQETIGTIAVFSNGKSGEFLLGSDKISARSLKFIGSEFSVIRPLLSEEPNLLIFSSETGHGANGDKLIETLKDYFPGRIYLSENLTGTGGDWTLEKTNATAPAPKLIDQDFMTKNYKFAVGH